ncbi:MAG: acylphosphatase [Proteobacteria bacterium]|nr:acylphosphatase [Pseudomonadota bacterium]
MNNTINCLISGKVQGVCFRISTSQQAKLLGITGWVRNLHDGRVEVIATGEKQTLDEFRQWLSRGPGMAEVSNVECKSLELQEFNEFTIR